MRKSVLLPILLVLYLCLIFPFTSYMRNKPFVEKLGYIPQPEVILFATADQKQVTAASLIMNVLVYFGGLVEQVMNKVYISPDFSGMRNTIEAAVKLDPYNMDGYYFVQAVMVWDMRQVRAANDILEYGMKYRDWDWYLPFFAGFNYAYILKDYQTAAKYYKRVGELTGNEISINLAGRYMYEAGQTDLAIVYLTTMEKSAQNDAIKKSLGIRLQAFKSVKLIESAQDRYVKKYGKNPSSVDLLLNTGFLQERPVDPYGGTFYFDETGRVRSTSKFAFGVVK